MIARWSPTLTLARIPSVTVNDCQNTTSLPGKPVAKPGSSKDQTAKRAFDRTTDVVEFYKTCFGRNSIDDLGMTLMSSIHYDVNYNNAFWNGVHMTYGDGDGQLFLDFTRSNDVIAHELTHGVTEYTSGFVYTNEPGGLNESMSDVFGSMFRQWQKNQTSSRADWLIGADIVGPAAKARGYKCLRDLAHPGAAALHLAAAFQLQELHPGRRSARQQRHPEPRLLSRGEGYRRTLLGEGRQGLVRRPDKQEGDQEHEVQGIRQAYAVGRKNLVPSRPRRIYRNRQGMDERRRALEHRTEKCEAVFG